MKKFKIIPFVILLLLTYFANSQGIALTGLQENPVITKYLKNHPNALKQRATDDTLTLPFFDDFSKEIIYPDNKLWLDKDVFINTNFGENPPSLGVATFDAIDSSGYIYSNANSTSFIGDYLTSKPIDLENYSASDSIYLSFYYQAQGFAGNNPETGDSLVLEFKDSTSYWQSIWNTPGSTNSSFKQIIIPVDDPVFLHNGFQFRFKNYASIHYVGSEDELSWQSNCDIWNLDYVYIDTSRSPADTIYDDISLVYKIQSPLNSYNAMPWSHFKQDDSEMTGSMTISIKNLYNEMVLFNSYYQITNITESDTGSVEQFDNDNVNAFDTFSTTKTGFSFNITSSDSALFEIKTFLQANDTSDKYIKFHDNDTAKYYQKFYNYYAYDDGTPEYGVGISGVNSGGGMMAIQYYTYQPDTLKALQIFFNHTKEEANLIYFYMNVWDDNSGQPGNIIYSQLGVLAEFNGLNKFKNYLFDTEIIVSNTFYIGWQKIDTDEMMNVGFDLSVDNKDKTFYSLNNGSQWNVFPYDGSIMVRPVFGKDFPDGNISVLPNNTKLNIYPNPASNKINIDYPELKNQNNINIHIYNNLGQIVYASKKLENFIDVSHLKKGIYFIKISNQININANCKFIISR